MDKKLFITSKHFRGQTVTMTVRLPSDLVEKMDAIAEKTGRSRNDIALRCIEFAVENIETEEE